MVTSSNGQVGTPDLFSGAVVGSIQTSAVNLYFFTPLLHVSSVAKNVSFIFAFFIYFFIAHFLLVENTYKNPYSLKADKVYPD
jgi:hypothetical protein